METIVCVIEGLQLSAPVFSGRRRHIDGRSCRIFNEEWEWQLSNSSKWSRQQWLRESDFKEQWTFDKGAAVFQKSLKKGLVSIELCFTLGSHNQAVKEPQHPWALYT